MKMKKLFNKIINIIRKKDSEVPFNQFSHLTCNEVYEKVKSILESEIPIICDLTDRDGKIGLEIIHITKNWENEAVILVLKNNIVKTLQDRFLYNIEWYENKNIYKLVEQDEYFEKITT